MRHWATRTIRDGKVRINGRTYEPSSQWLAYDGRLDGMRYLFGLYEGKPEVVNLWGPAAYARLDPGSPEADEWPRPEIVDGYFPWLFFHEALGKRKEN